MVTRLGAIQIDATNVVVRSHYLPVFSRLGPYSRQALDDTTYTHRELFEHWGHSASFLPVELYPLLRPRMRAATATEWGRRWLEDHPGYLDRVRAEVAERGPLNAASLPETDPGGGGGFGAWSNPKLALEWLLRTGELAVAHRRNFERYYDLTARVIPRHILDAPEPGAREAVRELLLIAARSLGVGTAKDLADYFRIRVSTTRPVLDELVEDERLLRGSVSEWRQPAYLHADARDEPVDACALVSPFDSLVWERSRTERLFGMRYRLQLYTPRGQRRGHYVLPFLLGEDLVARCDLKADREQGALVAPGAWLEPGQRWRDVAEPLAAELRTLAHWLGLEAVDVRGPRALASYLRGSGPSDVYFDV